jgi:mannose/fructose/N-acetylgalactosamine-specific phosphotransferase system component IIC
MSDPKFYCCAEDLAIGYGKTPLMEHIGLGVGKGSILTLIGGVLPAVGIALNLKVIMKKSVAPYFFMGFFLVSYLGMTMMGVAAFAIAAAALYLFNDMQKAEVA